MMYKVQPGDYLSKIATQHGVADWRVIYDHPNNASFRQLRPNPNLISPGDQLFIPDRGTKSLPAQTGSPARFRAHRARNTLQVKLLDHAGNPLANQACKLEYDGTSRPVTTDGSGVLRETVPPALSEALLIVNGVSMTLAIGHLNPMDNAPDHGVSGVQGRLLNLGFDVGPVDGELNDRTRAAIRAFREQNNLPDGDDITGPLCDKLREKEGC